MNETIHLGHRQFLDEVTNRIPGWLNDFPALMTAVMLERQEKNSIRGPLLEIGVFSGRYFSLLIRSAELGGDHVWGLDTFQYADEATVLQHLATIADCGGITLIKGPSTSFSAGELLQRFGARPRFISIDGSHEKDDVLWDLALADELLSDEGIVAVDDFLNPLTLGVNEAVNGYFAVPRYLSPFAYIENKLFLCRPERAGIEQGLLEASIEMSDNASAERWKADRNTGPHLVAASMWGKPFTLVR